jgi:ATP-dependent helicase HepA
LVIVPNHLRSQWQEELRTKFFLGDEYVTVLGDDELAEAIDDEVGLQYTMLVVDEAHQVALQAFASSEASRRNFEHVRGLARTVPKVLLLSGTPVLHQEDGFLAMLHLLDPDAYRLEDREAFRRRVSNRQIIADATADLSDDADGLFAEEALAKLESAFSDDSQMARLAQDVRLRLAKAPEDQLRQACLRALRVHVIETYRLHRRMVRTRREDSRLAVHLPRRLGWAAINHEDQARQEASEFLDAWRFEVSGSPQESGSYSAYSELFAHWVDCALSHPRLLAQALRERLSALEMPTSKKRKAIVHGNKKHGIPPAFPNEEEFVRARLSLLEAAASRDCRIAAIAKWLIANADIKKVVLFVDDAAIADEVAVGLGNAFGVRSVERLGRSEDRNSEVQERSEARVLVCDASSEEGLNLQQYGAALIHYDLPLAPTRIEQRIGRIDRLQARKDARNFVCLSGGSFEADWAECLGDGTRVFERSIAPLQYLVAELTGQLRRDLLENGREAFSTAMKKMNHPQSGLDAELRRVRAQEALDAFDGDPESDRAFFEALEGADELAEDEGPQALDGWVVSRLQFKRRVCEPDVFRYVYNKEGSPTLIPVHDVLERFRHCLDLDPRARQWKSEAPLRKCTFSRAVSESKAVGLLRVGHQFVDGMASYIREDDRGLVFAIWRHVPGLAAEVPQLYFRYDFVVEADLTQARLLLDTSRMSPDALKRRADEAFPVQYHTVWLDSDLAQVTDSGLLALLDQPYSKSPRSNGSRDVNLKSDHWVTIDGLGYWQEWEDLCVRSSDVARVLNLERLELQALCHLHAKRLRAKTANTLAALQARLSRLDGSALEAETIALRFEDALGEALAAGIEEPMVLCDSCGAVFLSPTALP